MLLQRAVPPGPPVEPEQAYGGLELGDRAPEDRPYVVCNFVSTADGKATAQGRSGALGGPADRVAFHLLRTQVDAILAGTGTLRVENYGRLIREEKMESRRVAQGREPRPLGIVITASGDVPWEIPLLADSRSHVVVYAPPGMVCPETAARIDLHHVEDPHRQLAGILKSLRRDHGVRSLLCEGGPTMFNAMIGAGLIDELFLTIAPALVGGGELPMTTGPAAASMLELRLVHALELEGTLLLRYGRR
jgi:riboflavin biosynthesis pyrimidine reductase